MIHGDVDESTFNASWSSLPWWTRTLVRIAVPFCALYLWAFATRSTLAAQVSTGELPTREEVLEEAEETDAINDMPLHQRDAHLLSVINRIHETRRDEPISVAVVYGARHMRAVTRFLVDRLGYTVADGDWVTVFDL